MADIQLLTFKLAGNQYGIDITRVQEIRVMGSIRSLPNTPSHFAGIIDFRNAMVPVVDLRVMFNYDNEFVEKQTVVIVVSICTLEGDILVGLIVDAVSDVLETQANEINPTPNIGNQLSAPYFEGLIKQEDWILVVLNLDVLLEIDDIEHFKSALDSVA